MRKRENREIIRIIRIRLCKTVISMVVKRGKENGDCNTLSLKQIAVK